MGGCCDVQPVQMWLALMSYLGTGGVRMNDGASC